jgi:hypothetical protein
MATYSTQNLVPYMHVSLVCLWSVSLITQWWKVQGLEIPSSLNAGVLEYTRSKVEEVIVSKSMFEVVADHSPSVAFGVS